MKTNLFPVIALFSITGLFISASLTPDARTDFQKIADAYKNAPELSIDVHYALYQSVDAKRASEEKTGNIILGKNYYYNRFGEVEILRDKSMALVADNSRKMLVLSKLSRKQLRNKTLPLDLDSALKEYKNITYKETGKGLGTYTLEFKTGNISDVTVEFSRSTFLIDKLEMNYRVPVPESGQDKTPPRIEIQYTNHLGNRSKLSQITVGKYVRQVKGKYTPVGIYKNYEFINNLDQ